jgi:hypothetical protein
MSAEIIQFDPLVVLNARWHTLDAQWQGLAERDDGEQADVVSQAMVEVEDRIAELVPTSPAGAAARLDRLAAAAVGRCTDHNGGEADALRLSRRQTWLRSATAGLFRNSGANGTKFNGTVVFRSGGP